MSPASFSMASCVIPMVPRVVPYGSIKDTPLHVGVWFTCDCVLGQAVLHTAAAQRCCTACCARIWLSFLSAFASTIDQQPWFQFAFVTASSGRRCFTPLRDSGASQPAAHAFGHLSLCAFASAFEQASRFPSNFVLTSFRLMRGQAVVGRLIWAPVVHTAAGQRCCTACCARIWSSFSSNFSFCSSSG